MVLILNSGASESYLVAIALGLFLIGGDFTLLWTAITLSGDLTHSYKHRGSEEVLISLLKAEMALLSRGPPVEISC